MEAFKFHTSMSKSEVNELSELLKIHSFTETNVMIATPCYGGQVSESFMRGILDISQVLQAKGIPFFVFTIANESLITRARNAVVAHFLGDKKFTHLMFIDADIEFSPLEFFRLLTANKPVAGGCYPGKSINWDKVYEQIGKGCPGSEIEAKGLNYMKNYKFIETEKGAALNIENDFVEVNNLATGFLMIQRNVLEKLKQERPQDKFVNDIPGYDKEHTKGNFYLFFDTMCDENGRYLSEDYAFCMKWREVGGQIWMDMKSKLTHTGYYKFKGDLMPVIKDELGMS